MAAHDRLAGRRSRDTPGPDQAPRTDSLDPRWGEDWRYIISLHPELRPYLMRVGRDWWDAGHRARRGDPNPVWLDPDIAGHDSTPTPLPLLGVTVDKIAPYWKAILGFITPGVVGLVAAVQDASPGGSAVTGPEWIGIGAACVLTGGLVFGVPNKDPRGVHQAESTQPPGV